MITKERLEELIEQGATIWSNTMWYHGKIDLINSDTDEYRIVEDNFGNIYLSHHRKGTDDCYDGQWDLEELREDVDCAEWEYKMPAERTERFEPPMWEDIDKSYRFKFTWRDLCIRFVVLKFVNIIKIEDDDECGEVYFNEPATEENYVKACEMVRDLFKGEK